MNIKSLFFLLLIKKSTSLHFLNMNKILDINHEINNKYDGLGKYKHFFQPNLFSTVDNYSELHDNIDFKDIPNKIIEKGGEESVKFISAMLPNVDSIGHRILHANDVYINSILNNDAIPHDIQKMLILTSIKAAQAGDNWGSHLLDFYYKLVDYFL